MDEPTNFSIPERNQPKQGPPPLAEVDESAHFKLSPKDSAAVGTGPPLGHHANQRVDTPKQGPPPLDQVDKSAEYRLPPKNGAVPRTDTRFGQQASQREDNPIPNRNGAGQKLHYWQSGIAKRVGIAAMAVLALAVLHVCLLHASTATFSFSLDGKPLPTGQYPSLLIDSKIFTSGDALNPGHHQVTVVLDGVETLNRPFWSFYGKKDLGMLPLESSKGMLKVVVRPSPASIALQRDDGPVCNAETELSVDNLRVGDYTLVLNRGDYTERRSVTIHRQQRTETNIVLQIGRVALASDPPDADFALVGNGRSWRGHLPVQIDNVPVGNYEFISRRPDWELKSDVSISTGALASSKTVFPYASINITSEPTGVKIWSAGAELGQTPLVTRAKPGHYLLTARDGEEESTSEFDVGPSESRAQSFIFRYGQLRVTSQPPGAKVILRGREVGYTPLTLPKVRAGAATLQGQLEGYESKEVAADIIPDNLNDVIIPLTSLRYLYYLNAAHYAARQDPPDYRRALEMADESLRQSPGDAEATRLHQEYGYAQNFKEANEAANSGDLNTAREKADAALSLKPDDAEAAKLKTRIVATQASRELEARQKAQVEQQKTQQTTKSTGKATV